MNAFMQLAVEKKKFHDHALMKIQYDIFPPILSYLISLYRTEFSFGNVDYEYVQNWKLNDY